MTWKAAGSLSSQGPPYQRHSEVTAFLFNRSLEPPRREPSPTTGRTMGQVTLREQDWSRATKESQGGATRQLSLLLPLAAITRLSSRQATWEVRNQAAPASWVRLRTHGGRSLYWAGAASCRLEGRVERRALRPGAPLSLPVPPSVATAHCILG